jgi:hypothetical protein
MSVVSDQNDVGYSAQVPKQKKKAFGVFFDNPYLFGVALFSTLGGFLFGYDQGVVSGVLTMESFGVRSAPRWYIEF